MSDYLPRELLIEILSRLPSKSLLKLRCVCKSWNSLITSPNFITRHLTVSNKNNGLFLLKHWSKETNKELYSLRIDNETLSHYMDLEFSFERQTEEEYLRVFGSCNGLICLSNDFFFCGSTFILCNPLIRKSITLPTPHFTYKTHGSYYPILGFGYDDRTDDYKLVRLVYLRGVVGAFVEFVAPPKVELYSLRAGTWETISAAAPNCMACEMLYTFANGAVHWLADRGTVDDLCSVILAFDICDEVFREMSLPKSLVGQGSWDLSISEFGESISVIDYAQDGHKRCDIWVMKQYNVVESWTKQYTIDLFYTNDLKCTDDDDGDYYGGPPASKVLGFSKDGETEMLLRTSCDGKLALFSLGSKQVDDMGIHWLGSCIKPYVDSLVLLDNPN